MNTAALKKVEIVRELAFIPDGKLDQIRTLIDYILKESRPVSRSKRSLQGIWRNLGFEKIGDLETELATVRKELDESILRRRS